MVRFSTRSGVSANRGVIAGQPGRGRPGARRPDRRPRPAGRFVARLVAGRARRRRAPGTGPQQGLPSDRTVTGAGPLGALDRGHHLVDLPHRLLAVPEHEAVHEVGQGLGIEGAVPAGHHHRVVGGAVGGVDRDPGQVDQIEDVGVDQLGGQIEGQDVEGPGGQVVLEGEQGHPGRPHGRLHVHPRGVGPLGHRVVPLVEDLVEDLQPLVGQADLVGVGIDEQPRHRRVVVLGDLGSQFSADVAGRLGDLGQQGFHTWPEGLHLPRHPRAAVRGPGRLGPTGLRPAGRPGAGLSRLAGAVVRRGRGPGGGRGGGVVVGPSRGGPSASVDCTMLWAGGDPRGGDRVGGQVAEDRPDHRRRRRGPEAGLVDHAHHHVLGVGGRPEPHEPGGGLLADLAVGGPGLAGDAAGEVETLEGPVGGAARVLDRAGEPGEQGVVGGRRQVDVAGDLGGEPLDHLARRGDDGRGHLGGVPGAAVGEGGVGHRLFDGGDHRRPLAEGHLHVVAGVPGGVGEPGRALGVQLEPLGLAVHPALGLAGQVDAGQLAQPVLGGLVLDGGLAVGGAGRRRTWRPGCRRSRRSTR